MPDSRIALRKFLKPKLTKLLRKTIIDYATFANQPLPQDMKGFAGHQTACKAALAHIDVGLKLISWAEDVSSAESPVHDDLNQMIRAAEAAVAHHPLGIDNGACDKLD